MTFYFWNLDEKSRNFTAVVIIIQLPAKAIPLMSGNEDYQSYLAWECIGIRHYINRISGRVSIVWTPLRHISFSSFLQLRMYVHACIIWLLIGIHTELLKKLEVKLALTFPEPAFYLVLSFNIKLYPIFICSTSILETDFVVIFGKRAMIYSVMLVLERKSKINTWGKISLLLLQKVVIKVILFSHLWHVIHILHTIRRKQISNGTYRTFTNRLQLRSKHTIHSDFKFVTNKDTGALNN